jgi:AcrR family transcriptional regulator
MPKIDAPTVAEHRAARREALLQATRDLLAEPGRTDAPSIGEVAEAVGMSRPAVYSYFASRDDLVMAAVHEAYPSWVAYVDEAMSGVDDPADRVLEYIDANLRLISRGDHMLVRGLAAQEQPASGHMAHESIRIPLAHALNDLDVDKSGRMAELIQAVTFSAARMMESGAPHLEVRHLVRSLIEPYVRAAAAEQGE